MNKKQQKLLTITQKIQKLTINKEGAKMVKHEQKATKFFNNHQKEHKI